MKDGFIQMPRAIQDSWIWNNGTPFDTRSAWEYIVMNAYWADCEQDTMFGKQTYKRGQYPTSTRKLSESWGWSQSKVNRFIKRLESEGMLVHEKTKSGSLLTIVNYGVYQGERITNESLTEEETNHERITNRRRNESQMNQGRFTNESEMVHEKLTIKENKEDNNINNIQEEKKMEEDKKKEKEKHKYGEYNHVMLTDAERDRLFDEYGMEQALEAIKFLDEYIEMKGYKAKSHNMALRKWVFDAVKEEKERKKRNNSRYNSQTNDINRNQQTQLEWLLNGIKEEEQNEQNGN